MKMGIGIGWPNSTSGSNPIITVTGWFNISTDCNGAVYRSNSWTQQITDTTLQTGQYVYYPKGGVRVLLGAFTDTPPLLPRTILVDSSEGFNSCPT
jgi:hypothetical protein